MVNQQKRKNKKGTHKKNNSLEQQVWEKVVPDTSIIIEGLLSQEIQKGNFEVQNIIIHEAVLAELENQANQGKAIGKLGLDELEKLRVLSSKYKFILSFGGKRPNLYEIEHAKMGEVDALIRDYAYAEDALLVTSDKIQEMVARAKGMKSFYIKKEEIKKELKLAKFFDSTTMSVHLREDVPPKAKKGQPGQWEFVELRKKRLTKEEIQEVSKEIVEEARLSKNGFIEIEREGSTIIQLGPYRIVITKPPLSDGWEITAVKPVKRLSLDDYQLSEKLTKRVTEKAEGILIAGAPGHGKTTFAQALAENYASKEKIIKTVEAPRDLILPEEITQYAISRGTPEEIHDILLLSRPDYTFFDEMRNTADFQLFTDMRLSGVGMVGVVHGTSPIDALQRFIGRIELGVIPQVIDTVVFIKNGGIHKVLSVTMTVKVPAGMTEADLARPVVTVNDFETGKLEFEVYSYGEETVVVPVKENTGSYSPVFKIAKEKIEREFKKQVSQAGVEMVSENKAVVSVPEKDLPRIIGKQGKNIEKLEKRLGLSLDVRSLGEQSTSPADTGKEMFGKKVNYQLSFSKKYIQFHLSHKMKNKDVDIHVGQELLITAKASKGGLIKINKRNEVGKILTNAYNSGEEIELRA